MSLDPADYLFGSNRTEPTPSSWLANLLATPVVEDPSFVMADD